MVAKIQVWRMRSATTQEALSKWHFTEDLCIQAESKRLRKQGADPVPVAEVIQGWVTI